MTAMEIHLEAAIKTARVLADHIEAMDKVMKSHGLSDYSSVVIAENARTFLAKVELQAKHGVEKRVGLFARLFGW